LSSVDNRNIDRRTLRLDGLAMALCKLRPRAAQLLDLRLETGYLFLNAVLAEICHYTNPSFWPQPGDANSTAPPGPEG